MSKFHAAATEAPQNNDPKARRSARARAAEALRSALGLASILIVACVLAGIVFVLADSTGRARWSFSPLEHVAAALALYGTVAALSGLVLAAIIGLEGWLVGQRAWGRPWLRAGLYAVLITVAAAPTATWAFSGERISQTPWRIWGPVILLVLVSVAAGLFSWWVLWAWRLAGQGTRWAPFGSALALGIGGLAAVWIDLNVFVALYSRLHTALEVAAGLCFVAAFALALRTVVQHWQLGHTILLASGAVSLVASVLATSWPSGRVWVSDALGHVWREEVYLGRTLRRFQVAEAFLRDPTEYEDLRMSNVATLKKRYDISSFALQPKWLEPLREDPERQRAVSELRAGRKPNILIYYVDTLRADVARDPSVMPNFVRFAEQSLEFRRAYATGSDTLRSLPGMTGGNYDVDTRHNNDLIELAAEAEHESVIVIAKSAREFLRKLRPTFAFEKTVEVADYPESEKVWGYGADLPTAEGIVDEALDYMRQRKEKPFFMWLFNFDQHAWRELQEDYVNKVAAKHEVQKEGALNWRYRTVARSVDEQFGRLLQGVESLGLSDDTIIMVVSDHGEGLGHEGFWVHSVFLWDSLIHVPLILHVPGIEGRAVEDIVSLVDVAPTLAPFLTEDPGVEDYQGEDLLGYALSTPPKRRLPILLTAANKDMLERVGIIDPERELKLVLPLEAAQPSLHDLSVSEPDAQDIGKERRAEFLSLLSELVQSPVFPRAKRDFNMQGATPRKSPPSYLQLTALEP